MELPHFEFIYFWPTVRIPPGRLWELSHQFSYRRRNINIIHWFPQRITICESTCQLARHLLRRALGLVLVIWSLHCFLLAREQSIYDYKSTTSTVSMFFPAFNLRPNSPSSQGSSNSRSNMLVLVCFHYLNMPNITLPMQMKLYSTTTIALPGHGKSSTFGCEDSPSRRLSTLHVDMHL